MADGQLPFHFDDTADDAASTPVAASPAVEPLVDQEARDYAVNPAVHVALEASAGTGKTKVLVDRYVNLLRSGVEPRRVLAITFTRKAAAEMRARIVAELTRMASIGAIPPETWKSLRTHLGEIAISTIDAFCLALLGEFPLEADVDPGFGVADETETPRLMDDALDQTLRIGRSVSAHDPDLALLFARMGEGRLRGALTRLIDRRLVALGVLDRFLSRVPYGLTAESAAARAATRLTDLFAGGRLQRLIATGPDAHDFRLLVAMLARVTTPGAAVDPGEIADALQRLRDYTCTKQGAARKKPLHRKAQFPAGAAYQTHGALVGEIGNDVPRLVDAHKADVNAVLARSLRWLTARAIEQYRRTLEEHAVVDFTDALVRALALLQRMEEFSQSRYRLESRYQHVLVDELQDTSRPQWALVELLVQAWGEGVGVAYEGPAPPSLFVVGDRKQSIYGFRDADVGVLEEAARLIGRLRPGLPSRRAIVKSFRAVPSLQQFVNDVCDEVEKRTDRNDAFRYDDRDRFPVSGDWHGRAVGLVAASTTRDCARAVAGEIADLIARQETVRDRDTGVRRAVEPGDIAILFRSRDSHRDFERELDAVGVPYYVYKGLGFFDADEVKDVIALIHYLAEPDTDRHAAAFLRSRFVRLSDVALKLLAPRIARALREDEPPAVFARFGDEDRRVFDRARASARRWIALADRLPPAELIDAVLHESAYAAELAGAGRAQARENLKKLRGLVRRLQNRGYATLGRIAARVSQLMAGDESNAIVDALDAVNLMTVHAAKGLEFPVVFVVNLSRGTGGRGDPVEVVTRGGDDETPGDDLVSIDALAPEAREEVETREREEAKRLVYVAVTRARDRLYLSTTLAKAGTFAPAPNSLGAVLPPTLGAAFAAAAVTTADTVAWTAASGATHQCRVVRAVTPVVHASETASAVDRLDDFAPLTLDAPPVRDVSTLARADALPSRGRDGAEREAARVLGSLVHRALAAGALTASDGDRVALVDAAAGHLDADVRVRAVETVARLAAQAEVRELISGADVQHEVPFSWRDAHGATLRAVADAVVRRPDGRVTVLEFKTGAAREADERQLASYAEGLRRLLPETPIDGRIIRLDE
ncbi:MAG: UvrD-helicase domain-containing protein [Vicinamibacterales bacterium]